MPVDGYKSLADVPAQRRRAAVRHQGTLPDAPRSKTELFGETGRKLDGVLSGGTGAIKSLGDELERTGGILSRRRHRQIREGGRRPEAGW